MPKFEVTFGELDHHGLEEWRDRQPVGSVNQLLNFALLQEVHHQSVVHVQTESKLACLPVRDQLEDDKDDQKHLDDEVVLVEIEQRKVQHFLLLSQ